MGKKGRVNTRRKPILQLDDSKKLDKKRGSRGLDYNQPLSQVGASAMNGSAAKTKPSEEGVGEDEGLASGSGEGGDVKSTEQMDSEIANFLKEISALGDNDSADGLTADETGDENPGTGAPQEEGEGAIDLPELPKQSSNGGDGEGGDGAMDKEKEEESEITFWQEVVDPNTNHSYYWNPKTNEVTWTLPENGVISDDTQKQPGEPGSTDETTTYADYYAYYAQTYYGVDPTQKESSPSNTASTSDPGTSDSVADGGPRPQSKAKQQAAKDKKGTKSAKAEKKSETKPVDPVLDPSQEGFVGPTLPSNLHPSNPTSDSEKPVMEKATNGNKDGFEGQRSTRQGRKRKAQDVGQSPLVSSVQYAKKPRLQPGSPEDEKKGQASTSTPLSRHAEQALRLQVSTLADELSRKLHYLHVGGEGGASDLQVLSVQLQTRLADWKDGGLSSKFMLSRLKQASQELQQYEESAAPPGWKCVWDSTSCRYKFHNLSTGESSWGYPVLSVLSPGSVEPPSSELSSQEGEATDQETAEEQERGQAKIGPQLDEPDRLQQQEESTEEEEEEEKEGEEEEEEEEMEEGEVDGDQKEEEKPSEDVTEQVPVAQQSSQFVSAVSQRPLPTPPTHPTTTKPTLGAPQQYQGPTAEYLLSQQGPPPQTFYRGRKPPPPPPTAVTPEPQPEEKELTIEEVRKKLQQKARRPLTSEHEDEKTEPLPPSDEEESSEEEQSTAKEEQESGLEFISEFPPPEPSPPPLTQAKKMSFEGVAQDEEAAAITSEKGSMHIHVVEQQLPEDHSLKMQVVKPELPPSAREQLTQPLDAASRVPQPGTKTTPSPTDDTRASLGGEPGQAEEGRLVQLTSPLPQQLPTGEIVYSRDPRVAKRQRQLLDQTVQTSTEPQVSLKEVEENSGQQDGEAKEDPAESEARMRERLLRRAKYRIRKKSPSSSETEKRLDSTSQLTATGTLDTVEESTGEVEPSPAKVEKVRFSLGAPVLSPSLQSDDVFQMDSAQSEARVEPETGEKKSVVELSKGAGAVVVSDIAREEVGGGEPEVKKERSVEEPGTPVQDERAEEQEQEIQNQEQSTPQEATVKQEFSPPPLPLQPPKEEGERVCKEGEKEAKEEGERVCKEEGEKEEEGEGERVCTEEGEKEAEEEEERVCKEEGEKEAEEEGEILSVSSPSPAGKPVGKCYMDIEEEEGGSKKKEGSRKESRRSDRHYDSDWSDYSDSGHRKSRSDRSKQHRSPRSRSRDSHRRSSRRRRDNRDYSDYSDEEYKRKYSDDEYKRSSSRSHRSKKSRRYRDDYSDYSDESYHSSHRSRRHRDDYYSDNSDDDYYSRGRDGFRDKSSRKSRKESERDEGKYSRRSRHRRSRSRSKDSREKDRERDGSKKRKKDKKEKKKRHHKADKSPSKEGSGGEAGKGPPKQPPNVLVGKVGRLGSVRTLGQEKKLAEEAKAATSDGEVSVPATQEQSQLPVQQTVAAQQMQVTAQPQNAQIQQMVQPNAAFYQQPSTGQIPYYPLSVPTDAYQAYDSSATVYQYQSSEQQQGGWQQWSGEQQQQQQQWDGNQQWAEQQDGQYTQGEVQSSEGTGGDQSGYVYGVGQSDKEGGAQLDGVSQTVEMDMEEGELIAECEMEIDENSPDHENASQIENVAADDTNARPAGVISETGDSKLDLEMPVEPPSAQPSEAEHVEEQTQPGVAQSVEEQTSQPGEVLLKSELQQHSDLEASKVISETVEATQPSLPGSNEIEPPPPPPPVATEIEPAPVESKPAAPPSVEIEGEKPPTAIPEGDRLRQEASTGGSGTPPPPGTEPEVPPPPGEGGFQSEVPPPPGEGGFQSDSSVSTTAYQVPSGDTTKNVEEMVKVAETTQVLEVQTSVQEAQSLPTSQENVTETTGSAYTAYSGTQAAADYYQTSTMAAPQTPGTYNYGAYAQMSVDGSQQPYDYSAYAQAGYGYAQAYNAYLQQAAAAASYGGYSMTPPGQYYPASYPTYASYGSPYGYYSSGTAAYSTSSPATDYQQQQVAAPIPTPAIQPPPTVEASKKGKKSEFALPGSKEKQVKSMMEKWNTYQSTS